MRVLERMAAWLGGGLACLLSMVGPAIAGEANPPYPDMAPVAQYAMASPGEEIDLARSAAPPSISAGAEILVLGPQGYETAVKGQNGFVCLVERSWTAGFEDPVFWNPQVRGPNCLNPAAARSVLPHILQRARWVLSGVSKPEMVSRTKAQLAANAYVMPESGAMSFMMSRRQNLSNAGGHWHPHVMFYVIDPGGAPWGADVAGSPVIAGRSDAEPVTVLMVPVAKWSDGTPETMDVKPMEMN